MGKVGANCIHGLMANSQNKLNARRLHPSQSGRWQSRLAKMQRIAGIARGEKPQLFNPQFLPFESTEPISRMPLCSAPHERGIRLKTMFLGKLDKHSNAAEWRRFPSTPLTPLAVVRTADNVLAESESDLRNSKSPDSAATRVASFSLVVGSLGPSHSPIRLTRQHY